MQYYSYFLTFPLQGGSQIEEIMPVLSKRFSAMDLYELLQRRCSAACKCNNPPCKRGQGGRLTSYRRGICVLLCASCLCTCLRLRVHACVCMCVCALVPVYYSVLSTNKPSPDLQRSPLGAASMCAKVVCMCIVQVNMIM